MSGIYRQELNAATMLGQSKTVIQAEIDSAAELIDFIRYIEFKSVRQNFIIHSVLNSVLILE